MRLITEATEAAQGFRPLILQHHTPKSLFGTGARSARRAGAGDDFFEYRPYVFGDNAQKIDWRQSARSDDVLIREQDRLLPHRVYIFCDNSAAMQFNSRGSLPTKAYNAQLLLLSLSILLMQGESEVMPLGAVPRHHNLDELAQYISTSENEIPEITDIKQRSHIIIISDFRQGEAYWREIIGKFSAKGAFGSCIQLLDPMEHQFPLYGRVRLESAEDDDSMIIPSADAVRPIYLARLEKEKNAMAQLCHRFGWHWISLTTDMAPRQQLGQIQKKLVQQ